MAARGAGVIAAGIAGVDVTATNWGGCADGCAAPSAGGSALTAEAVTGVSVDAAGGLPCIAGGSHRGVAFD
jgi:hypothetical protein